MDALLDALDTLNPTDRDAVVEWLRDCAKDAAHDEPEVGIFGNPRMAAVFNAFADLAIADTHPKDGDVKQAPLVSGGGAEGNRPKDSQ